MCSRAEGRGKPIITIAGVETSVDTTSWSPVAIRIYEQKKSSKVSYDYRSAAQLRFEMALRAAIVAASEALSHSGLRFADFNHALCNTQLWTVTEVGGFRIRDDSTPAAGIQDIFINGSKYATECATASSIAVYKGVLDSIPQADFNRLFDGLVLYDWHVHENLRLTLKKGIESFPGDLLYFDNPDFSPDTPQWRGENVIKIDENRYYGHPFGIVSGEAVIAGLNRKRRPDSTQSAYLTEDVAQPGYEYLSRFAPDERSAIRARIGNLRFVR